MGSSKYQQEDADQAEEEEYDYDYIWADYSDTSLHYAGDTGNSSDTAARREQCLVGVAEPGTGGVFSVLASSGLVTVVTPGTQDAPRCVFVSMFVSSQFKK